MLAYIINRTADYLITIFFVAYFTTRILKKLYESR